MSDYTIFETVYTLNTMSKDSKISQSQAPVYTQGGKMVGLESFTLE
jgi:hypothetical protein